MGRKRKQTVEFLYDFGLSGDRVKGCDFVDEMQTVIDLVKEHPDADYTYIEGVDCDGWKIDFFVIYRPLMKRVTGERIEEEFRAMIAARFKEDE